MDTSLKEFKVTCVGDGYVGKTCLLWSYVYRKFPKDYVPTVFETHAIKTTCKGETYTLSLYDTAGQEDWETLRIMAYPDTDVIVLCFSVVRPDSMENIKTKWVPELNKYLQNTPIILVGTQCDLRKSQTNDNTNNQPFSMNRSISSNNNNNNSTKPITTKEGEELRSRIKAYKYIECSALTQLNINEVFEACIEACTEAKVNHKNSCFRTVFQFFGSRISSCTGDRNTNRSKRYKK